MKQETLEEAGEKLYPNRESFLHRFQNIERKAFTEGAKWQQERSYSEDEVLELFQKYISTQIPLARLREILHREFKEWLEQFKKK